MQRPEARIPARSGNPPLPGLTIPGLANCHSHAFHRALRGRTQRERGTFWTWREQMYDVAARLDPDTYLELATVDYREMVAAGITAVGEFHYLHHQPDGTPYDDPNAMGHALIEAARRAGIRITLLDTCYLSSGFGAPPEGAQGGTTTAVGGLGGTHDAIERATTPASAPRSTRSAPSRATSSRSSGGRGRPFTCTSPSRWGRTTPASGVRHDPDPGAGRGGCARAADNAVHATHLTEDDVGLLGEQRDVRLLLPHHRARPR